MRRWQTEGCRITKGTKGCRNDMQLLHILIKKPRRYQSEILSCSLGGLYPAAASDFLDTFPLKYILRKTLVEVGERLKQMMVNLTE